jgi:hypothetical protein
MTKKKIDDDMRVEPVEGAPISLKKVMEKHPPNQLMVMVNGTGVGIVNDDPHTVNVTIADREMQADYFFGLKIEKMPEYLRKYLEYMFEGEDVNLDAMYKYASTSGELRHIIAIVQLVGGGIKTATREKKGVRFFLEEPETRLHPKRERRIIGLLEMLRKDFGPPEETKVESKTE